MASQDDNAVFVSCALIIYCLPALGPGGHPKVMATVTVSQNTQAKPPHLCSR